MKNLLLCLMFILLPLLLHAQGRFNVEEYKSYLEDHKDMSLDELYNEFPAGKFMESAPTDFSKVSFSDSILSKYGLTEYEIGLLNKNSFMVTERLSYTNLIEGFFDVFNKDLPVYISADAILHPFHYSFNEVLKWTEEWILTPYLKKSLETLNNSIQNYDGLSSEEIYIDAFNDFDIFLTVACNLCSEDYIEPYKALNKVMVDSLLYLIYEEEKQETRLFSDTLRPMDYSMFRPRSHYTDSDILERYFRTMMWLGRAEFYITNPGHQSYPSYIHSDRDLQRQAVLTAIMAKAAQESGASEYLDFIDDVLVKFIGEQDNISYEETLSVMNDMQINSPVDLLDSLKWEEFRSELLELNSANQLINSQILYSDPFNPEQAKTPVSFLLMGARATIDGFVTSNVVYDKIIYDNEKVRRMLPSTLDVLFALGNDAAPQLLEDELKRYNYSGNLAGLRYLISSYDDEFWNKSIYTNWLNAIRLLSPPADRSHLPRFMQTAAWWQKTMNTQLASWAELRHDFLLYAKQPYTGGLVCSYPFSYVEPVPEVYRTISECAAKMTDVFENIDTLIIEDNDFYRADSLVIKFFNNFKNITDTLSIIAEKELAGISLDQREIYFLQSMLIPPIYGCGNNLKGWYVKLYFWLIIDLLYDYDHLEWESDYIVADIHTAPTDEDGTEVGWVKHIGTGPVNMAFVVAQTNEGYERVYAGPVKSYFELTTSKFNRLTDHVWQTAIENAEKPSFVNYYMADENGKSKGEYTKLHTYTSSVGQTVFSPDISCFPNPFKEYLIINFNIPPSLSFNRVLVEIHNLDGSLVKTIVDEVLDSGAYAVKWNGLDDSGQAIPVGIYLYKISIGNQTKSGKVILTK